jgi:hypothetical protein
MRNADAAITSKRLLSENFMKRLSTWEILNFEF